MKKKLSKSLTQAIDIEKEAKKILKIFVHVSTFVDFQGDFISQ